MDKKCIRCVKDEILDCADRLELVQALILYRMDIFTTGVYSERVCLSEEILKLSEEILDSLVNDLRTLVESGFYFQESENIADKPLLPADELDD